MLLLLSSGQWWADSFQDGGRSSFEVGVGAGAELTQVAAAAERRPVPAQVHLADRVVGERELDVEGRSSMNKAELIAALRDR